MRVWQLRAKKIKNIREMRGPASPFFCFSHTPTQLFICHRAITVVLRVQNSSVCYSTTYDTPTTSRLTS